MSTVINIVNIPYKELTWLSWVVPDLFRPQQQAQLLAGVSYDE